MKRLTMALALLALVGAFAALSSEQAQTAPEKKNHVTDKRRNVAIVLYEGVGSSNSKVRVNDFRFYVSDVRLVDASGRETAVSLTSDGKCHAGFNLSGPSDYAGKAFVEKTFHNNGLYNTDGKGSYPADNTGRFEFTSNPKDMGEFKVPTLRNVELTAPYMHDGSVATQREVIEHYKAGGRTIAAGEKAGAGSKSPHKSSLVRGFELTEAETDDLLAFLRSLTDRKFVNDPKFGDPWQTN